MTEEEIRLAIVKAQTDLVEAAIYGPNRKPPRQTALRMNGNSFESVEIDDNGNVIEPPKRCPNCGPIYVCSKHMPA